MAELGDIIQRVLLEGDDEVVHQLEEIGEKGFEAFNKLLEAAEKGDAGFEGILSSLGKIIVAIGAAGAAVLAFVEHNDAAIQTTNFLADAMETTTEKIAGLEAAFAAAGVSTHTFETFATRLSTTIGREWPAIAENIRTSSTQQEEAQQKVVASTIRVQEAQQTLGNLSEQIGNEIASANAKVRQTYIDLEFASQHAASLQQHNYESVRGAALGLEQAQQRLNALTGAPASPEEAKALQIKEAQLAVDKARTAQADALLKQQQDQAEAAAKRQALELANSEAVERRAEIEEKANTRKLAAENAVREAVTARAAAEEKAYQTALGNIPNIVTALNGITDKNKEAAKSIDLTTVSTQKLKEGIIAAASTGNGKPPTAIATLSELIKVLSSDTDNLISQDQRLALVQSLGQRAMQQTGASVFELLNALEKGQTYFDGFEEAAKKAFYATDQGKENVRAFRDAFEQFSFAVQTVGRNLSAAASPVFTSFLQAITESLTKDGGLLHDFIEGLVGVATAVTQVIKSFGDLLNKIEETFDLKPFTLLKVALIALVTIVAAFGVPFLAIPAAIILIVLAIGAFGTAIKDVGKAVIDAWNNVKDNALTRFLTNVLAIINRIRDAWTSMPKWLGGGGPTAKQRSEDEGGDIPASAPILRAGGGAVQGPGSGTSDSILARLSNGEFVMRAAAVRTYGAGLFEALNSMSFPGFANGGLVPSPVRLAGGGPSNASSTLNLTIGDRTFSGLRGSKNTIDDLSSYAISRQTSSAGRRPDWVK